MDTLDPASKTGFGCLGVILSKGGIFETGEIAGSSLRSHSSKGQECYTYFYNDRTEAEQGWSSYFPRGTLSVKEEEQSAKILVAKRTDDLETGESQKVEMEEDDKYEYEFQLTKGPHLCLPWVV